MNPEIRIFEDNEALSFAAADIFARAARQAISVRGRFLTALSGGGTPLGMYRLLAAEPFRSEMEWDKTHIFWGDERCVPPDDPGSNYPQAQETLLALVPIPPDNIHRIKGELTPQVASDDYTQLLIQFAEADRDWPRFDFILLGMGEDGHTASLFPGSPVDVDASVLPVTAHYQDRPANRVTLTPPVINDAHLVVFLTTGAAKAVTLSRVLSDKKNDIKLPAQRIQPHDGKLVWLVDKGAASQLTK